MIMTVFIHQTIGAQQQCVRLFTSQQTIHFTTDNDMRHIQVTTILALLAIMSCTRKDALSFEDSEQALDACREELHNLRGVGHASINQVITLTQSWTQLRDSVANRLIADSTDNTTAIQQFLILSDSIRRELVRIAGLEARSMQDLIHFKMNITEKSASEYYEEAMNFYETMDKSGVYPDVRTTIEEYTAMMNGASINDEKELKEFLMREDRCFRSLMAYLNQVPRETLDHLAARTEEVFSHARFTEVDADLLSVYLTMRLNRRVLQDAQACRMAIKSNDSLVADQCDNYRYTLLQPFVLFDHRSMAVLTPQQKEQLCVLARELPELLARMDRSGANRQGVENSLNDLATFVIKSYIATLR